MTLKMAERSGITIHSAAGLERRAKMESKA
jgi:hypothetical protein